MKHIALIAVLLCLTGCPQKTTTQTKPDGSITSVTQADSGEASRLAMNFLRERAKLQAKVHDANTLPGARLEAQYQIDAMDSALALSVQVIADKLAENKLVYQRDAQGREVYYLEPIRTPATTPGMVSP